MSGLTIRGAAVLALLTLATGCARDEHDPAGAPARGAAGTDRGAQGHENEDGHADEPATAAHDGAGHDDEDAAGRPEEVIRIDPGMLRDLRITTAPVERRPASGSVEILGELHPDQNAYAEVGAPIPARVVAVHAVPGMRVARGDVLVELESAELGRARAAYQSAQARAELARQTLARQRGLAAERIAPERRVQEATAAATEAEAAVRAATAELHALGTSPAELPSDPTRTPRFALRAPIDGTVLERTAVLGQLADPAAPLVRVGDLEQLWLIAHAFERDAVRIAPGATARVKLTALPGRELSGTVALVGSSVEPASRTIPIRITLANEGGLLRPGMSATVRVALADEAGSILAVPAAALQRLADGWVVFLRRGEGSFEVRRVGRGRDLGGEVEVVSGLSPDERVVVDGAFLLKAEAEKARGGGDAHHAH